MVIVFHAEITMKYFQSGLKMNVKNENIMLLIIMNGTLFASELGFRIYVNGTEKVKVIPWLNGNFESFFIGLHLISCLFCIQFATKSLWLIAWHWNEMIYSMKWIESIILLSGSMHMIGRYQKCCPKNLCKIFSKMVFNNAKSTKFHLMYSIYGWLNKSSTIFYWLDKQYIRVIVNTLNMCVNKRFNADNKILYFARAILGTNTQLIQFHNYLSSIQSVKSNFSIKMILI